MDCCGGVFLHEGVTKVGFHFFIVCTGGILQMFLLYTSDEGGGRVGDWSNKSCFNRLHQPKAQGAEERSFILRDVKTEHRS